MFRSKATDPRQVLIEQLDAAVNSALEAKLDRRVIADRLEQYATSLRHADACTRAW
jgi:hypothetical protein